MNNYKQTFGIKSRHKKSVKPIKGDPGIGFKLTNDNNYDLETKRLTNVGWPKEYNDALTKEYFIERIDKILRNFIGKNEDIDMNNKAIKNLSWPDDINDAIPKKYLYQNGLLMDNKINSFNAKDKKIANVLDPEDLQDVATKNYVDSLDNAIHDSLMKRIEDANKNVPNPVDDGDAVNKKYLLEVINANTWETVLPPHSAEWILYFEMDLGLFYTVDPRVLIVKGTVKIKQDVITKSTWIGNIPLKDKPTFPILLYGWQIDDHKTYDFLVDNLQKISRHCIIDHDKRLIVYGDLREGNTLYFNGLISI